MTNRFDGTWYVTFFCDDIGPGRSMLVDRLIIEPLTQETPIGRIHMTINNLNHVNSYMEWESRELYKLRIKPRPDAQSWVDFLGATIVSYGTQMGAMDNRQQLVYEMSWMFRVSSIRSIFANNNAVIFKDLLKTTASNLKWQDVGF